MGQNLKFMYNFNWHINGLRMSENNSVANHIIKLEILAKNLSNAGHSIVEKRCKYQSFSIVCQELEIMRWHLWRMSKRNSAWALYHMEKVRLNRRKDKNSSNNLLLAESSHNNTAKSTSNKFKKKKHTTQWKFGHSK